MCAGASVCDKTLHFKNTFIIIISLLYYSFQCHAHLYQKTAFCVKIMVVMIVLCRWHYLSEHKCLLMWFFVVSCLYSAASLTLVREELCS